MKYVNMVRKYVTGGGYCSTLSHYEGEKMICKCDTCGEIVAEYYVNKDGEIEQEIFDKSENHDCYEIEPIEIDGKKIYPSWENLFWYLDTNNIKYDFDQKYNVLNVPLILDDGRYLDKEIVNNICKFDNDMTQVEIWTYDIVISFLD